MRYTYIGRPDLEWPDIACVPVPGDVYDWPDGVTPTDAASWEDEAVTVKGLAAHTKAELVAIAATEGLELDEKAKKDDLIAALEEHRTGETAKEQAAAEQAAALTAAENEENNPPDGDSAVITTPEDQE